MCPHCRGVSANQVPYHKKGCQTALGGWSDAQRRAVDRITTRINATWQRRLDEELKLGEWEWEYEDE